MALETATAALPASSQVPAFFPTATANRHNHLPFPRRRFNIKCSIEYSNNGSSGGGVGVQAPVAYPRPAEVQWKKELCNTVHLIGVVGVPIEIKQFPSGKVLASTRLAVKKSATDTSWY